MISPIITDGFGFAPHFIVTGGFGSGAAPVAPASLDRIFRVFSGGSADIFRTAANAGGAKSMFRTYSAGNASVFRLTAFSFIDEVLSIDTLSDIDTLQN